MSEHPGADQPGSDPAGSDLQGSGSSQPAPRPSGQWASEQPPAWQQPGAALPGGAQGWEQAGWQQQPGWQHQPGWAPPPPAPPKPGVIALRPLGVGEILDGAISTIRSRPRVCLGLSALVATATQLVGVPVTWLLLHDQGGLSFDLDANSTGRDSTVDATQLVDTVTTAAIAGVLALIANLFLTGILMVVLSRAVLGREVDAAAAWGQARSRIGALFGVTLLVTAIGMAAFGVVGVVGVLLIAGSGPVVVPVLWFLITVPAAFVLVVYCYTAFALAPAIVVLERQSPVAALRRSRALVRGAWWRTFGILLLINLIAGLISAALGFVFGLGTLVVAAVQHGGIDGANEYGWLPLTVRAIGDIAGATISWPLTAIGTGLLYVDRRMRREGLDIELARAAAEPAADPQSPAPGTP